MEYVISLIPMIVCYLYANEIDERIYSNFKMAHPLWYALGGYLFGLIPMIWLWNKVRIYNKYR